MRKLSAVVKYVGDLATLRFDTSRDLQERLLLGQMFAALHRQEGRIVFSRGILNEVIKSVAEFTLMSSALLLSNTHFEYTLVYPPMANAELNTFFSKVDLLLRDAAPRTYKRKRILILSQRSADNVPLLRQLGETIGIPQIGVAYVKPIVFWDHSVSLLVCVGPSPEACDLFDQDSMLHRGQFLEDWVNVLKNHIDLYQAEQAEECFVADASHKLKAPMQWLDSEVGTLAEYCRVTYKDDSRVLAQCEAAENAVETLSTQTRTYSFLTVMDKGELRYDFTKRHSIGDLLEQCVKRFRNLAADRQVTIALSDDGTAWERTYFDWDWMEVVVTNLLDNAIKYSFSDKVIGVRAESSRDDKHYFVSFRDFGLGISERERELIFERFYRGRDIQDPKRFIPGTGIGLTVAREIVRAHGGDIELAVGKGSSDDPSKQEGHADGHNVTFTIRLPKLKDAPDEEINTYHRG